MLLLSVTSGPINLSIKLIFQIFHILDINKTHELIN